MAIEIAFHLDINFDILYWWQQVYQTLLSHVKNTIKLDSQNLASDFISSWAFNPVQHKSSTFY